MHKSLVHIVRLLLGADYLVNGVNWWFKLITPYPSISDFVSNPPPPDMVGGMIQTGFMFHIVKACEVLAGVALLSNRFVPLLLVVVYPVTLSVFLVDVFLVGTVRGFVMGGGAFVMNSYLLLAYFGYYRGMFTVRAVPDFGLKSSTTGFLITEWVSPKLFNFSVLLFGVIGALLGVTMVSWVGYMMIEYLLNPLPLQLNK